MNRRNFISNLLGLAGAAVVVNKLDPVAGASKPIAITTPTGGTENSIYSGTKTFCSPIRVEDSVIGYSPAPNNAYYVWTKNGLYTVDSVAKKG